MKRIGIGIVAAAGLLAGGCEPEPGENPYNEQISEAGPAAAADSTPYTAPAAVDTQTAPAVAQP